MKIKHVTGAAGISYGWSHWCPGCDERHVIPTSGEVAWGFNGDVEHPSFTPSVRLRWEWGEQREERCCHYFITDGAIQFCTDSTHALAGQTVPLPDLPE